ncbi:MAG: hypothetical protein UU37_C0001G0026 [Candidatus Gottesmanbacteria bacterium GW2011_GWA2_41_12]|uniref:tRNA threonylcarbamoyladenosine biosynthesis protein TsaE n=2 Tax=Candidatus Gottesmaniibacteriota TaxID=1752720 RepID=A0A0G0XLS9_9BACT|nr:MAG: hypothetical protein UT63_C0005G0016 [Candidatus Gottesmanbacteria bacterium GW2011_GWC2_39_8]KKR88607.1 MAG: hypothetical protein UU37_C0001G0026 [Candidatus Gottesmanbacteria bacterium GW2011_GWA2_41_12]
MKYITSNVAETEQIAKSIGERLKGGEVLCLYGDLGSGKTTFTQALGRHIGIKKRILSPTFIIVRHYDIDNKIIRNFYHLDLYRLSSIEESQDLDINQFLGKPGNITVIEWPEKIEKIIQKKRINIYFKYINENTREITVDG